MIETYSSRHTTPRSRETTTAVRICVGIADVHVCTSDGQGGRVYAVEAWPWQDEEIVRTHGLCDDCAEAWNAWMDAAEAPR